MKDFHYIHALNTVINHTNGITFDLQGSYPMLKLTKAQEERNAMRAEALGFSASIPDIERMMHRDIYEILKQFILNRREDFRENAELYVCAGLGMHNIKRVLGYLSTLEKADRIFEGLAGLDEGIDAISNPDILEFFGAHLRRYFDKDSDGIYRKWKSDPDFRIFRVPLKEIKFYLPRVWDEWLDVFMDAAKKDNKTLEEFLEDVPEELIASLATDVQARYYTDAAYNQKSLLQHRYAPED